MHRFEYRNGALHAEGVPVETIAREAGTPLYIYSRAALLDRVAAIRKAFSGVETGICFSVKSCSSLGVLGVLREAGCAFDVVSGGELFRVLRAGADAREVVYAGVGKTEREIRFALEHGIRMFNVESEPELAEIDRIARAMGTTAPVALRLNPDVDPKTHKHTTTGKKENKFGLDLERAGEIVDGLGRYPGVVLKGLHVHIGSPVNTVAPYGEALDKVLSFLAAHPAADRTVETINAGGGFGLLYREETVPAFDEYAAVIVPRVLRAGKKLLLEPGRSIVGNAAVMLAEVQYRKWNGEKTFLIVDAGMNDLIRPAFYESFHFLWPVRSADAPPHRGFGGDPAAVLSRLAPVDVVGPICESSDCFAKERLLPPLGRGDLLAFFSAGAYGFTMASSYNSRPRPAEVLVDGDRWRIIRARETWEDLVRGETV